jgi:hypothetical protein
MATPVRVVLTTASGEVRDIYIEEPPTSIRRGGFSREQICRKFIDVCAPLLGDDKANAALDTMLNMEKHDVRCLAALLRRPTP